MEGIMLKIDNVSKEYKLGQIGGTTLRDELQRRSAKRRGLEDPTKMIGAKDYTDGETFMALDGVSFEVKKGERVGIIGHNGAGKSTLLKLISRVTAPTGGSIYLNGRVASMLEVGTGFHGELTGRENIYMNGAILGMTKKEIDAKIEDIIDFSECRQFIDTPVKRYSSGMYVKLAFSVAAHLDSEIMIMDEVLAVGDMAFQKKCLEKMSDVSKAEGRTILYVSHNMNTIRQLCDRVIVMDHGKIVFDGDVEEGIGIYMEFDDQKMEIDIDLRKKRMPHLPHKIEGKIEHVHIMHKKEPTFSFNESICFEVTIRAYRRIEIPAFRIEVRSEAGITIGTSIYQDLSTIEVGITDYSFMFNTPHLYPGKYQMLLILYEFPRGMMRVDLDAVCPGFVFEVVDDKKEIKVDWTKNWGRIKFDDLILLQE